MCLNWISAVFLEEFKMHITAENLPEHFPKMPKRDLEEIYKIYFPHYIIYKKQQNKSFKCYCTKCKSFFENPASTAPEITEMQYEFAKNCKHNQSVCCPHCQAELQAKSNGRIAGLEYFRTVMIPTGITKTTGWIIQTNLKIRHNHVDVLKQIGSNVDTWTYNVIRIENNKITRFVPSRRYNLTDWGNKEYFSERTTVWEPTWDYFYEASKLEKNTRIFYIKDLIMPKHRIVYNPLYMLAVYLENPAVEKLIKAGFNSIKRQIESKKAFKQALNLNAKKINEILRLPAQTYSKILKSAEARRQLTLEDLKIIQCEIKNGNYKIDLPAIFKMEQAGISAKEIKITKVSCAKLKTYFQKQQEIEKHMSILQFGIMYKDYIKECQQLGYDLTDKMINRPKRLTEKHAETARLVNLLKDQIQAARLQKKYEKYKKMHQKRKALLEWEWQDLKVIVPDTAEEILNEGKTLNHCVGGYAERHIQNKTTICFVREKRDLLLPCWTMEVRKNEAGEWYIVQLHGFKNQDKYRREHFQAFKAAYEEYLGKINKKERKKCA